MLALTYGLYAAAVATTVYVLFSNLVVLAVLTDPRGTIKPQVVFFENLAMVVLWAMSYGMWVS